MLLRENHLFGCSWLKPSQASVSVGLALAADFGFCFQCKGGSSLVLRRPIEIAALIRSYRLIPCENQMNSIRNEAASSGHLIFFDAVRLASRPNNER
jgi:hypothetical protein